MKLVIFHDGKKFVLVIKKKTYRLNRMICSSPQCFVRKDIMISPHDLTFLLIKKITKLNY